MEYATVGEKFCVTNNFGKLADSNCQRATPLQTIYSSDICNETMYICFRNYAVAKPTTVPYNYFLQINSPFSTLFMFITLKPLISQPLNYQTP